MNYLTRENEIRATISKEEAIHRIEKVYHARYDPNHALDIYDQLLACEAVAEASTPEDYFKNYESKKYNENVSVSGNDNGSCKFNVNSELNWYKSELIFKLKGCNSKSTQNDIAFLLKEIFKFWLPLKENFWLSIAQTYTARTLNWVLSKTIKVYKRGGIRKTPPAYFVYLLKFRKIKKELRNTNVSS